jgi:hypothetical protein
LSTGGGDIRLRAGFDCVSADISPMDFELILSLALR